jgi:hypothetical protein
MTTEPVRSLQQQAQQAFERDLPNLWAERPGQRVAYKGEQRLGFAAQKYEMYQECSRRGLQPDEFVVFCIEAQETEMFLNPIVLD